MSDGTELRTVITDADLSIRAEDNSAEWLVEGIAVPWGQVIRADGELEQFERGSADPDQIIGQAFYAEHSHIRGLLPVGSIIAAEDRAEGLWIRCRISQTDAGREVYTLLRDGVLRGLSVGFVPLKVRTVNGVNVYTSTRISEVSTVARAAYSRATVTAVRSAGATTREESSMTPEEVQSAIEDAVSELRTRSDEQARQLAVLADGAGHAGGQAPVLDKFRSLGAFVKGLAPGKGKPRTVTDEEADELTRAYEEAMETRAYTGATTAELGTTLKPAWIDRDIKFITERRRIFEQFSSERLPSEGLSVEYPKFGSRTGDVDDQAVEGDDLDYLELVVTTATASVLTGGGYSQLTRKVIERSSVAYLNKVLQMHKISYARWSNLKLRNTLTGLAGTNADTVLFADKGKAGAWTDCVLQAASDFELNSTTGAPDLWIMGLTQFRQLVSIEDTTGRPVFVINGDGSNTVGNADLRNLRANVAGMPVWLDPGLTGTDSYICSREALTTMESGPFTLNDENIVNLSKAFSIYGYLTITANDAKGVTKVSHPAA